MKQPPSRYDDIYAILGIRKKDVKVHTDQPEKTLEPVVSQEYPDPNAPSGSIFDKYSTYPKEEQGYWKYFRCLTVVGVATCIGFLVIGIWGKAFSFSSASDYMADAMEDYEFNISDYTPSSPNDENFEINIPDESKETSTEDTETTINDVPEAPSGSIYLKGTINGKYRIHMMLDFDEEAGKYYYDKSGAANCMTLAVTEATPTDDGVNLELKEYNASGELCGIWRGVYAGDKYTGYGEFLGKTMPFSVELCPYDETDF